MARDRIDELHLMLGEKVSLGTWRRLARHAGGHIDPPIGGDLADAASGSVDPDYYPSLRYEPFAAPLDTDGIAMGDVRQGNIGDCWLIAPMVALARQDPDALGRMVRPNPNGTFTVTFADGSRQVVSTDLPTEPEGRLAFARNHERGPAELWPALVEKAYAQKQGSWTALAGGQPAQAYEVLTGRPTETIRAGSVTVTDLADRLERGETIVIATIDPPDPDPTASQRWQTNDAPEPFRRPPKQRLEPSHGFVVTAVDRQAGTVTVVNPWHPADGSVVLTQEQLNASIDYIDANTAP